MSDIYRCPKCDSTAIETLWDFTTEDHLRKKQPIGRKYIFYSIAHTTTIPNGEGAEFLCPYCEKYSRLYEMTRVNKVKIRTTDHMDEDLFTL